MCRPSRVRGASFSSTSGNAASAAMLSEDKELAKSLDRWLAESSVTTRGRGRRKREEVQREEEREKEEERERREKKGRGGREGEEERKSRRESRTEEVVR